MKLAIWMSRFLEPDEREAVLGDLEEAQSKPGHAFVEVGSLVLRRQAALWHGWQPWAVSLFFVLPIGVLLTLCALELQGNLDLYYWILRNYRDMDPSLLQSTGLTLGHGVVLIVLRWALLAITSWTNGFVLGALSRRSILFTGTLFFLVLSLLQALLFVDAFSGVQAQYLARLGESPSALPTLAFPLIVLAILVVVPLLRGIRQGINPTAADLSKRALWTAACAIPLLFYWLSPRLQPSSALLILVCWPLAYLLVDALRHRFYPGPSL